MTDRLVPVLIALGGFLGSVSRYFLGTVISDPGGTLLVNVVGSLVLALSVTLVRSRRFRVFLSTGLLSSFTTYSTFAVETTSLGPTLGVVNVGVTYVLGIAAALVGLMLGRRFA